MSKKFEINRIELLEQRVDTCMELLEELMKALKKASPETHKQLVINTKLNDFYLIRAGAK